MYPALSYFLFVRIDIKRVPFVLSLQLQLGGALFGFELLFVRYNS